MLVWFVFILCNHVIRVYTEQSFLHSTAFVQASNYTYIINVLIHHYPLFVEMFVHLYHIYSNTEDMNNQLRKSQSYKCLELLEANNQENNNNNNQQLATPACLSKVHNIHEDNFNILSIGINVLQELSKLKNQCASGRLGVEVQPGIRFCRACKCHFVINTCLSICTHKYAQYIQTIQCSTQQMQQQTFPRGARGFTIIVIIKIQLLCQCAL